MKNGATMRICLGALLVMMLPLSTSFACECPPPLQDVSAFDQADAVFVGVPSWIEDTMAISGPKRIQLKVTAVFKGSLGTVASVETPASPAACGIYFELHKPYLVFAEVSSKALIARACKGTKLMSRVGKEELAALGKPNKPMQATRETRAPER
jgi:hypothetical protein